MQSNIYMYTRAHYQTTFIIIIIVIISNIITITASFKILRNRPKHKELFGLIQGHPTPKQSTRRKPFEVLRTLQFDRILYINFLRYG